MDITGRCHCGSITYRAKIDTEPVTICNCTDCQQLSGSAYRVTVSGREEDFELLSGEPTAYVKQGESGGYGTHYFCPRCGSPLYRRREGSRMGIRLGSIDQRADLRPTRQIWCRSALSWTTDIGNLPQRSKE